MTRVNAYAVKSPGGRLEPFSYELPPIGSQQVDIRVLYCGICYSDISMIDNEWDMSQYPMVPGHEIVGEVISTGTDVHGIKPGDKVGMGWFSQSCMHCSQCITGNHQLCKDIEQTQVGRYGGFADIVRGHWSWIIPLPDKIDPAKAGPLFCGGSTVFTPLMHQQISPTHKVGVIGIGGLGHLALQFLRHWGCEVFAFSSNPSKHQEIKALGATHVINSKDPEAFRHLKGKLNFILNTANAALNWNAYLDCLAPFGQLHTVGIISNREPFSIPSFNLINGEKSLAGSPGAGPALTRTMLEFCVRHNIYPIIEEFPLSRVNEAVEHLRNGKARYRVVLGV